MWTRAFLALFRPSAPPWYGENVGVRRVRSHDASDPAYVRTPSHRPQGLTTADGKACSKVEPEEGELDRRARRASVLADISQGIDKGSLFDRLHRWSTQGDEP
jgi:hypothetical protein